MLDRTHSECLEMAKAHLRAAKSGGAPLNEVMKLTEQIRSLELATPKVVVDVRQRMDPVSL